MIALAANATLHRMPKVKLYIMLHGTYIYAFGPADFFPQKSSLNVNSTHKTETNNVNLAAKRFLTEK